MSLSLPITAQLLGCRTPGRPKGSKDQLPRQRRALALPTSTPSGNPVASLSNLKLAIPDALLRGCNPAAPNIVVAAGANQYYLPHPNAGGRN